MKYWNWTARDRRTGKILDYCQATPAAGQEFTPQTLREQLVIVFPGLDFSDPWYRAWPTDVKKVLGTPPILQPYHHMNGLFEQVERDLRGAEKPTPKGMNHGAGNNSRKLQFHGHRRGLADTGRGYQPAYRRHHPVD